MFPPAPYDRDPKDRPYMDLAVAAEANYLITRDKDLLSLMTSHTVAAKEFRQRHQNRLRIVTRCFPRRGAADAALNCGRASLSYPSRQLPRKYATSGRSSLLAAKPK